ncbi:MAG TPA: serine hydrolase [Thermoanaerobaculia bacterium]|jgi:CubicO group peptidase (beta-lactamase class C family)
MRLLSAVLALALAVPTLAQKIDPYAIDKLVASSLRAWQIPGAAIAIVHNDRIVYLKGYGSKDMSGTDPVGPDTLFQIASTSKAFTTAAMAMLVDEKLLSWDDPVRKHVDYFHLSDPCADASVTLRDIVSHRTGLSRHDELWDNSPLSREEVIRRMGHVDLARPFRTAYQYQNIMFITAGEAVANASGMPWDEFVRTRLFVPLGMTRTITSDAQWEAASDRAAGHRWDSDRGQVSPQRPIETQTLGAGGAIKSTARDMANWIRFQLADGFFDKHRFVSAEAIAETKMPQTVIRLENATRDSNPETSLISYGMGWVVQDYRGELLVSHSGSLNGFRTHVDLFPKRGIGFVVLLNAGRSMAAVALRNSLADMLNAKAARDWNAYYLMLDGRAAEKEKKAKEERLAKRRTGTTPSHPLADYVGKYDSPAYGSATVTLVNGQLVLEWSRITVPLTHWHYDVFTAESPIDDLEEMVTFGTAGDGMVKTLTIFGQTFTRDAP